MSFLRRLHLYLGCFFAPTLIFFAVSGKEDEFLGRLQQKVGKTKEDLRAEIEKL